MSLKMKEMGASLAVLFVLMTIRSSTADDTISQNQSISERETLVSAGEGFELGFFNPGSSTNLYLGIWYKKISVGKVVWVANRETPLADGSGVLKLTEKGILVLLNSTGYVVWSSNSSRSVQNPVAQLLRSGNLVIRDESDENPENYLWQSFDYPCDTMLPDMKIGSNSATGQEWFLSSWKSVDDPAPGDYSVRLDTRGSPQLVVRNGSSVTFRAGPWNGLTWSGTPALQKNPVCIYFFTINGSQITYKYELRDQSFVSKLEIQPSGSLARFTWIEKSQNWMLFFESPTDQCDTYGFCGAYGMCSINSAPLCTCLEGFVPKSPKDWDLLDWTDGCVRKTPLNCHDGGSGDGFLKITGMKLPDTTYSWFDTSIGLQECEDLCSRNCSCTAYANSNLNEGGGGSGCLLWFTELVDIKEFNEDGQDIYVRLAASELAHVEAKKKSKDHRTIAAISGSLSLTLVMGIVIVAFLLHKRKRKLMQKEITKDSEMEDSNDDNAKEDEKLTTFDVATIKNATDGFSFNNLLGEGGFGPVYKGMLKDGKEIAVKRLSKSSGQGIKEFKNEVLLIAKLQHINLVKLLGCCIQGDERMLIYEYMPNKSLDCFIFDEKRSRSLDWHKRFEIIGGIARGLLYLHQDSRLRIIHRDLKASNVLLDSNMNPKISDFGLAKTFERDQSVANTKRVVGTYGYMSPEYTVDGLFSVKSDVFSFGVLVLEIISGKRNRGFSHSDHGLNLLGHAWRLWVEERALELLDNLLYESCDLSQILRCIHVGLLCVQRLPEDRPNMSAVVVMLGSESSLPPPKQPGFYTERNPLEADSSSSKEGGLCSINEMTTSLVIPR